MPFSIDITITNPDGQKATATAVFSFTPAPTIASVSPSSGPAAGGTTVTISGANFAPGAVVLFGDKPASKVTVAPDGTSLTCVTPAA